MNTNLQLRTTHNQTLAMTAQLTQSLRLLQLSSIDLEQEIEAALAANPFLERDTTEEEAGESEAATGPSGAQETDTLTCCPTSRSPASAASGVYP
jgi:RNA polymerase sigma-54 factor